MRWRVERLPPSRRNSSSTPMRGSTSPGTARPSALRITRGCTPNGSTSTTPSAIDLTPLNASPERVQARGTVYWQAEFPGALTPKVIKAVVGEDWIIERAASGDLKFVLYVNTFHHFLP